MAKKYSEAFKKKVLQRYLKGESISSLCQELNVSKSTLYRWFKSYGSLATPEDTYTPAKLYAMSSKLKKLEHELEIIRISQYLEKIPVREKLMTLEQIYNQHKAYSVHELCEALGVSRGTFYNHIFRRVGQSKYEEEQEQLMGMVLEVFHESEQRYGAEKIRTVLAGRGVKTSKKRVSAIMKELDLRSIRTDAKRQFRKQQLSKKNILERNFTAEHPNQTWVSDITYFKLEGNRVFLCIILDLYSRKIIAYRISKKASTNLVTATFREAYEKCGHPENLTFHSDRGTQYTSTTFMKLLQSVGATQSFSASGRPCDNAVAEAFFASFKKEEAYRREYTSEQSFRKSVERYIQFYNEVRPHQTLRFRTPQAFERAYYAKHGKSQENGV